MFSKVKSYFFHEDSNVRDDRWIFSNMLVGGVVSLIAAFVLSVEAIQLAKNPNVSLSCSINVIINCATVAKTTYASLFGFPNSFLGIISSTAIVTVAVAGLSNVKFPRLFMFAGQLLVTFALIFAFYLFFIGLFIIQAICPWCFLVTLSTTFVWFAITRYNIREENLYLPEKLSNAAKKFISKDFDKLTLATVIFLIFLIIVLKYGNGLFA